MKYKQQICAAVLAGVVAVSALNVGLASWKTEITANGNVMSDSKWEVIVEEADIRTSTGASIAGQKSEGALVRSNERTDNTIVASICSGNWLEKENEDRIGTQDKTAAMSATTHFYAVDKTKFDLTDMTQIDREEVKADESTVTISDHLHKYYAYAHGYANTGTNKNDEWKALVMDGFLRDTTTLLKEKYPDTFQNYTLVSLVAYQSVYYKIAEFESSSGNGNAVISTDKTSVTYADVSFGLPGSWAEYSLTVKNTGSVDANIANAVIELDTESEQLTLKKPDLENEMLRAGESCQITFLVQVPENVTEDLNATGGLNVKLPYSQTVVEDAPEVAHTHN